jgi:hypothetical protein
MKQESKFDNSEAMRKIILENDYEGIMIQDGWETLELTITTNHNRVLADAILLHMKLRYKWNLYEIYTCNPYDITEGFYAGKKAGEVEGWDIQWVIASNDEALKDYPFFDCIITKNDNSTGRMTGAIIWK